MSENVYPAAESPCLAHIEAIIQNADAVKPEERRRFTDIREMRADIAARSELREARAENARLLDMLNRANAAEAKAHVAIELVREMCHDTGAYQAAARGGRFSSARVLAVEVLAALDGER
ncbi:hypothetical protein DEU38_13443 [Rhodococcus sp. AG1013]|uniref:hypothetical protein n=1 Tax=Rhodococcus sp. AG1013 TaxID=2183996 RepID=UPI000E0B18ED|nr:hypothetical protein [Rhodococcus sp. AG1013]RDI13468.1 hypothetical protein DEU38_13443 [Rhodococcus sp. AG1013]